MQALASRWVCLLSVLLCLLAGCSDDDVLYNFTFSARAPSEEPNIVALRYASHGERSITAAVRLEELDLAAAGGLEFDLIFGPELLEFMEFRAGSLLEEGGGVDYSVELDAQEPGRLHVRILQQAEAEPVVGTGTVLEVRFRALDVGTTYLDFDEPRLMGAGPEYETIGGILWFGAMIFIF